VGLRTCRVPSREWRAAEHESQVVLVDPPERLGGTRGDARPVSRRRRSGTGRGPACPPRSLRAVRACRPPPARGQGPRARRRRSRTTAAAIPSFGQHRAGHRRPTTLCRSSAPAGIGAASPHHRRSGPRSA
jgi:hypothetical protein